MMLTKTEAMRINKKLISMNMSKRDLSVKIGYPLSYSRVINVINRKVSSNRMEYKLRRWLND